MGWCQYGIRELRRAYSSCTKGWRGLGFRVPLRSLEGFQRSVWDSIGIAGLKVLVQCLAFRVWALRVLGFRLRAYATGQSCKPR